MQRLYPESWRALRFPAIRAELIEMLDEARSRNALPDVENIKFLMHFFFDDHPWTPATETWIGEALFDQAEVDVLKEFVAEFDRALGPRSKPLSAISTTE